MKKSMPPIIDINSKILILGSLPGERSLQLQAYYAHARNQFWKIICLILDQDIPKNYEQKKYMLLCNYIALWDIIGSANRNHSSLDSKIKNVKVNDIETLLMDYDNIQLILLNGGKASKEYQKHFKHLNIRALPMPSTSPAYARMGLEEKMTIWQEAVRDILLL